MLLASHIEFLSAGENSNNSQVEQVIIQLPFITLWLILFQGGPGGNPPEKEKRQTTSLQYQCLVRGITSIYYIISSCPSRSRRTPRVRKIYQFLCMDRTGVMDRIFLFAFAFLVLKNLRVPLYPSRRFAFCTRERKKNILAGSKKRSAGAKKF